jgi:hypothetical protein
MLTPLPGFGLLLTTLERLRTRLRSWVRISKSRSTNRARLHLESLESREVPSATQAGVISLQLNNNTALLSPDFSHIDGGSASQQVYDGSKGTISVLAVQPNGVLAQFASTNVVNFSPDGTDLSGGGNTVQVYDGSLGPVHLTRLDNGGVLADFTNTNKVFFSPNDKDLAGVASGTTTTQVYDGAEGAVKIMALPKGGVLVQFTSGTDVNKVFLSLNDKDLAGVASGTATQQVYDGSLGAVKLVRMQNMGVMTQVDSSNAVFFSSDFTHLTTAGGNTTEVYDGSQGAVQLRGLQANKGVLTQFLNNNHVTYSPDYTHLGGGGQTVTVYNGSAGALQQLPLPTGGVLAIETSGSTETIFLSPDDKNLVGGGNTTEVYSGAAVTLSRQYGGGILTRINTTNVTFFSSDFKSLAVATGATQQVYNGKSGALTFVSLLSLGSNGQHTVSVGTQGLKIVDEVVGTGAAVKKGDKLSVNYNGYLTDGSKFDSSIDPGIASPHVTPFQFTIGATPAQVIQGWEQGIIGMQVGGLRKLIIPSVLGYGTTGFPPSIPPNADLVFEVELLSIG